MLVNPILYPGFFETPVYRYSVPKPKLVRKTEGEDAFQFQILKEDGDFTLFEFKLVKLGTGKGLLILFSEPDEFKVEFELDLNQIDAENINFGLSQYDRRILNLNIPKKQVHPMQAYFECFANQLSQHQDLEKQRIAQREIQRQREEKLEQERQRKIKEALAKQYQQRKEQEARLKQEKEAREAKLRQEREAREARLRQEREAREARLRKEREEQLRKQREEQAQREKQAKIQKEKEYRLWKVRQEKLRKEREQEEQARREQFAKAQEQFAQFFTPFFAGNDSESQPFFPSGAQFPFPFGFANSCGYEDSSKAEAPEKPKSTQEPVKAPTPVRVRTPPTQPIIESPESGRATPDTDDAASIASEDPIEITLPSSPSETNKLHKHPSLEEVEDEEFVMLRKKFGQ